jgi:hypothetical protein
VPQNPRFLPMGGHQPRAYFYQQLLKNPPVEHRASHTREWGAPVPRRAGFYNIALRRPRINQMKRTREHNPKFGQHQDDGPAAHAPLFSGRLRQFSVTSGHAVDRHRPGSRSACVSRSQPGERLGSFRVTALTIVVGRQIAVSPRPMGVQLLLVGEPPGALVLRAHKPGPHNNNAQNPPVDARCGEQGGN